MRRPQTKTPYAYIRRGNRKRGRPVHRIYRPTLGRPMTGQCLYFAVSPTGSGFTGWVCYSKNGNDWWGSPGFTLAEFTALKVSATQGRFWNANGFWLAHTGIAGNWVAMFASDPVGNSNRGPGIGACPYTPDDHFTF